jgi:NADH dehydrogenase
VAIIGAGATGVELAAELHHTTRTLVSYGLDRIDPERDIRIELIEAGPRILGALPERMSASARGLLEKLRVRTNARVTAVTATGVQLAGGETIPAELVVWAAGVKAPEFLAHFDGLESNRINQLVVGATLRTTRDENVFAIGDCAAARAGGAPAGLAPGQADPPPAARPAAAALALPRLRLAGIAGQILHSGQPDGLAGG